MNSCLHVQVQASSLLLSNSSWFSCGTLEMAARPDNSTLVAFAALEAGDAQALFQVRLTYGQLLHWGGQQSPP